MKPASTFRTSFLTGCALFALCAASSLQASDALPPSVEIHLDVLSTLSATPAKAASAAETPAPAKTATHHTKTAKTDKSTKTAKTDAKAHEKKVAATKHKHKTEVAKATPPATTNAQGTAANVPVPQPEVKPVTVADATPPALPPADIAQVATAQPKTADAAPTTVAGDTSVPKLPEADVAKPAPSKQESAVAGMTGGFADLLGGDSDKAKAPAAAPAATASLPPAPEEMPLKPQSHTDTPPKLDASPSSGSPALADAPPPLAPDGSKTMASNDLPAAPTQAPVAADAKPDLPSLPTDKGSAPQEMAQSTLTPLPGAPSAAAPASASPPPAAAAVPTPVAPAAPAMIAPQATPAPAAPASPVQAADAGGATPDLRVAFNESETEVPLSSTSKLDAIAKTLHDNPGARVNIMAYASGPDTAGIYPKRVSLARGIAVRNYLTTTKGIDIERVNVKALGNKNAGGPGDRVDIFVLK